MILVAKSGRGIHLSGPLFDGLTKLGTNLLSDYQLLAFLPSAWHLIQRLDCPIAIDCSNHGGLDYPTKRVIT